MRDSMRPLFRTSWRERVLRHRRGILAGVALVAVAVAALHGTSGDARATRLPAHETGGALVPTAERDTPNARASRDDPAESATVPLLVASPRIAHPVYANAVIFAAPLPAGGHLGIILNRPTEAKLGEMFPDHPPSQAVTEPVFFGGPVQREVIVAVIRAQSRPSEAAMPIARDMYIAFDAATIDAAIETNRDGARFYSGVVVWAPAQLARQLAEGLWTVKEVDARKMLQKPADTLWRELAQPAHGTRYIAFP